MNKDTLMRAWIMRRNPTTAEKILWHQLKNGKIHYKFRRQAPIGGYIADFYCPRKKLIVEADGLIHKKEYDDKRDRDLLRLGYETIRFTNDEILTNMSSVLQRIIFKLHSMEDKFKYWR